MGLMMSGKPIRSAAAHTSATVAGAAWRGVRMPAASSTCFISSLSRNGHRLLHAHPRQPELLADPSGEDDVGLPQALDPVDPHVPRQARAARPSTASSSPSDTCS